MDAAADPLQTPRQAEGTEPAGKPAESQDDGYETSNSGEARRRAASPAPSPPPPPAYPPYHEYPFPYKFNEPYDMSRDSFPKRDCEDPYSFVEEEACALLAPPAPPPHHLPPHQLPHHQHPLPHHMMMAQPKKRGRKKKIKDENGMEIKCEVGADGALLAPRPVKERKKHDRFNGMSEEEVARRTLPDHLAQNLDIIIIGINPGLFAAYKGHHYAGPGNHFWKCLYLSGLTREQMSADEDYKLLNFGIGFTNMVSRPTKGSADLTRREIKEGSAILLEKLQSFRPKVAVFNGKLIYEVFSGKKEFCFGKQPDPVPGTNTYMWVMPSSSARCAQLPRAADKVPFYAALKKFRDYLNGLVAHVADAELVFPDTTARRPQDDLEIRRLTMEPEPGDTIVLEDGTEVPLKKKRGRPKKIKLENGETAPPAARAPRAPRAPPPLDGDGPPKKKRGRPKKIRPEDQQFLLQQQQQTQTGMQLPPQQQLQQQQQYGEQQPQQQQQYGHQMMYQSVHDQYNYHAPTPPNQTPSGAAAGEGGGGVGGGGGGGAGGVCEFYSSPRHQYSPSPLRHSPAPFSGFVARSPLCAASPAGYSHSPGFARSPAPPSHSAPPPAAPRYPSPHNDSYNHQGGSSCGSAGSAGCALGGASPHAPSPIAAVDFSPPPTVGSGSAEEPGVLCGAMFDNERLYMSHSPHPPHPPHHQQDKPDHYHYQEQGGSVPDSPRMEQMHQHPNMYQNNYNRATPDASNEAFSPAQSFRHSEHHLAQDNDSQGEFINTGVAKTKPQDVASKSLSGLESLVDQIPSIAEGGGGGGGGVVGAGGGAGNPPPADAAPSLPDYAPLYPPYPPYGASAAYGNNGYGGAWVGYGGGWAPGLVRGGGYLPPADWQYSAYTVPPYSYTQPYYNYPQQQTHYLSAPGLLELHKNVSEGGGVPAVPSVPSVGFGPFC